MSLALTYSIHCEKPKAIEVILKSAKMHILFNALMIQERMDFVKETRQNADGTEVMPILEYQLGVYPYSSSLLFIYLDKSLFKTF
jgi:hypothetical protein